MRMATDRHPEPRLRRLLGVFKAFSLRFDPSTGLVSLGVEVDPVAGVADTGGFADDLAMLFEVLGGDLLRPQDWHADPGRRATGGQCRGP
jgi:hypothetical protein